MNSLYRWMSAAAVAGAVLWSGAAAAALGKSDEGTKLLNAHGESMQLEFKLYEPGTEAVVDYEKYGTFTGLGTDAYEYKITDRKGLAAAAGEGIYPNNSVYKDPAYRMLVAKGKLGGSQWDYVNVDDQQRAFYKWASSHDTPAVQQFYTALALEKLGQTLHAIKAYHAVLVHFPKQNGWSFWHTPLYLSRTAIDRIHYLTHRHPELGIKLVDADILIENGYNAVVTDDRFTVNPGRLVKVPPSELKPKTVDVSKLAVTGTTGTATQLVRFENGHWQLRVDGKPYLVKAVAYSPTPVGQSPDEGYDLDAWWSADADQDGKIDAALDAWLDKNRNGRQDPDEPSVGDFQLMKEMGVNTLRVYHHGRVNKELLRTLYLDYGIRVIMGDLLGMYGVGSGADWYEGTDYIKPEHQDKMKESVRKMLADHKDEPYVLLWMLGNESNYGEVGSKEKDTVGTGSQARHQLDAMYAFVDEVAGMIKSIDPTRPVAFSNGDVVGIDVMAKHVANVDIFGTNSYRGESGFGYNFWNDVRRFLDKPVLLTEYGCPAFFNGKSLDFAETRQLDYHRGNWEDLRANAAGSGFGSSLGGVIFEWVDEWWKAGPPPKFSGAIQESIGQFQAAFPDGWMHEEWLGLLSQGDGSQSPRLRVPRKAYDYYRQVWNE